MSAQEILKRIEVEVAGATTNKCGWDFRQHMLEVPVLSMLKDHNGEPYEVWVVLKTPGDGYSVVFDPDRGRILPRDRRRSHRNLRRFHGGTKCHVAF